MTDEKKAKPEPKPKLKADPPWFGSATVYRTTVTEAEAVRLQSQFGFRVDGRDGDKVTMGATSEAFALYKAAK